MSRFAERPRETQWAADAEPTGAGVELAPRNLTGADPSLLRRYVESGSQDAFSQIVCRHSGWVYQSCRRSLHDGHLAEDATQAVFLLLSRKASTILPPAHLAGWLFQACRYVIANVRKNRARYLRRQAVAREMTLRRFALAECAGPEPCPELAEALDAAMASLRESDRQTVLMHFYEGLTLRQMGAQLDITKEGAKKRVNRALSRLRRHLEAKLAPGTKKAVLPMGAVLLLLRARAAQAAPVDLAMAVQHAALSPGMASPAAELIVQGVQRAMLGATGRLLSRLAITAMCGALLLSATAPLWLSRTQGRIAVNRPLALGGTAASHDDRGVPSLLAPDKPRPRWGRESPGAPYTQEAEESPAAPKTNPQPVEPETAPAPERAAPAKLAAHAEAPEPDPSGAAPLGGGSTGEAASITPPRPTTWAHPVAPVEPGWVSQRVLVTAPDEEKPEPAVETHKRRPEAPTEAAPTQPQPSQDGMPPHDPEMAPPGSRSGRARMPEEHRVMPPLPPDVLDALGAAVRARLGADPVQSPPPAPWEIHGPGATMPVEVAIAWANRPLGEDGTPVDMPPGWIAKGFSPPLHVPWSADGPVDPAREAVTAGKFAMAEESAGFAEPAMPDAGDWIAWRGNIKEQMREPPALMMSAPVVPEPSTIAGLLLGAGLMAMRRQRTIPR